MRLFFIPSIILLFVMATTLHADDHAPVSVLTYSEYIDPQIPKDFEKATGHAVKLDFYETQDDMLAKLQSGALNQYDVIIATDVVVPTMIKLRLLQPLDQTAITNSHNVMPRFINPKFDPDNRYSYPYQWGTIGLFYRVDKLPTSILSWALLFDPARLPGPFVFMDEMRSMSGIALKYLGYSASSRTTAEIVACGKLLLAAKSSPKCLGFDGGVGGLNRVLAGEAVAAVVYNGDAIRNMPKDGSCAYAIPKEGSDIWVDNMLLSAKAPNQAGGNAFINYVLDAKVGAQLSNFNRYASPNQASLPFITREDASNPVIYPSEAQLKTLEFQEDVGAATKIYDEMWTTVKAR